MTDFANRFQGSWRDGELPRHGNATLVVNYDQRNHGYTVEPDEYSDFVGWVAGVWHSDNDPQDTGESDLEYITRRGIAITDVTT